jgi:flavorubredoxin
VENEITEGREVMTFKAVEIAKDVYWVGAIDWPLSDFHGYTTYRGSTYNAYLVVGDEVILVDTVKKHLFKEMVKRIASVIPLEKIDYVISNHAEMDHSGALVELLKYAKPKAIIASQMGAKNLKMQLHNLPEITVVKDGEEKILGGIKFKFIETRMLHWPDSMFTWLPEREILFSQDAFGMHYAVSKIFVDENDRHTVEWEMAYYYANILMPYSNLVLKLLERVEALGIKPKIIASDHGPIFRGNDVTWAIQLYRKFALQEPSKRAIIVYDTMWGSTELMAKAIADGIVSEKVEAVLLPLSKTKRSDVATEILYSGAIIVGSPTINNTLFPSLADVLTYLFGLRPQNKIGAVFGSYGWSGEATKQLVEYLEKMKIPIIGEVKCQFVPDDEKLRECFELGVKVARELKNICGEKQNG